MSAPGSISAAGKRAAAVVKTALFLTMILIWAFPVIWVIMTSFKARTDIFTLPPKIFFSPTVEHYLEAFLRSSDITRGIRNSLLVAALYHIAYAVNRRPRRLRLCAGNLSLPPQLSFFALISQIAPPSA